MKNPKLLLQSICLALLLVSCKENELLFSNLAIDSISLKETTVTSVVFNAEKGIVTITVPYGQSITQLSPRFILEGEGESIPASGTTQNFTQPVYYTIIHPTGGKKIYQFVVVQDVQPTPVITSFSVDELTAGEKFIVTGKYFGNFGLALKAAFLTNDKLISSLAIRLIDDTQVEISVPDTLTPTTYKVSIGVNDKSVISTKLLKVNYPPPYISAVSRKNVLPSDTIKVNGRFLNQQLYDFELLLSKNEQTTVVSPLKTATSKNDTELIFVLPKGLSSGNYEMVIANKTTTRKSLTFQTKLNVQDPNLPNIIGINQPKAVYIKGETISFQTLNYDKVSPRFYQILLKKGAVTIAQNGTYTPNTKLLSLELPTEIEAGTYQLDFFLSNPTANYQFGFSTDFIITIQ